MNKTVSSNLTSLAYAEEASLKVLPGIAGADAVWYGLEPNTYKDFGATFATVARQPIVNTRQTAKGTITDLDAKAGFNADLTQRNLTRLLQGFFFRDALEKPGTNLLNSAPVPLTDVDAATHQYRAAAGLGAFLVGHLALSKNFSASTNNGLFHVTVVAAGAITTDKVLADEAAPPAAATVEAVGFQFAAGDLVLTVVGATIVLTSTAITMTTLGLNVGEWIVVGGDAAGSFYANNAPFYARIKSIGTHTIVLDQTMATVIADAGAAKLIQIFFGKMLLNAVDPADIKRRTYQLERQLGSDDIGVQSEIVIGAVPNEIVMNLPQAAKITTDVDFVGMDVAYRSGTDGLLAGTRVKSPFEDAYNTTHDIVALRLAVIDPATGDPGALFAYGTDLKLTVKNSVVPNKALAVLGAIEASTGNFEVDGTMTAYFTTVAAAAAIRNNSDVCLAAILAKKNSGFIFDLPLLMLGNGQNKVEKDKAVMVDLTQTAAKCAAGYTASMCFFEYLPTAAMPA